jgi:hypothetical protein
MAAASATFTSMEAAATGSISALDRKFVGMAIDDRLMLISEVDTIAAPRNGKGAFVDSETRQRARMVIYATDRRELQIKVPIGGIPQSVVYPARSDLTGAHA